MTFLSFVFFLFYESCLLCLFCLFFEVTILHMQQKHYLDKYTKGGKSALTAHRTCVFHFGFVSQFHKGSLQNQQFQPNLEEETFLSCFLLISSLDAVLYFCISEQCDSDSGW